MRQVSGIAAFLFFLGTACSSSARDADTSKDSAAIAQTSPATAAPQERVISVTGGGTVIQILPGPFAMADSAAPIIARAPAEMQEMLKMLAKKGPFSDETATVSGSFAGTFWDRGEGANSGDSVAATATFKSQDGASWRFVIDRVAPEDGGPMDPHWGGVGTEVTYHGSTGLGLPLVPTVNSSVSYYGMAHVYRNEKLLDDNAPIHVMLSSQTRGEARGRKLAYKCWDCTKNPVEQLHVMLMPPAGKMYEVPGGIIHVMWQTSTQQTGAGA